MGAKAAEELLLLHDDETLRNWTIASSQDCKSGTEIRMRNRKIRYFFKFT
jgi:hypothetical protein